MPNAFPAEVQAYDHAVQGLNSIMGCKRGLLSKNLTSNFVKFRKVFRIEIRNHDDLITTRPLIQYQ